MLRNAFLAHTWHRTGLKTQPAKLEEVVLSHDIKDIIDHLVLIFNTVVTRKTPLQTRRDEHSACSTATERCSDVDEDS
jgi:hypothetical protein